MTDYDNEIITVGIPRATCHQALRDIPELQHHTKLSSHALASVYRQMKIALIKKDNVIHD